MIYSNHLIQSGQVKIPPMPAGYVWCITSSANGEAFLGLLLDGEPTEFIHPLRMPDTVNEKEQTRIVQRAASSIRWDYVTAFADNYMDEEEEDAVENIIHAENRFKKFA